MKKIAFAFLAAMTVLSFAGCKKKGGTAEIMAKMESFKNDMCKCKAGDKACAEKVGKDMQSYMESMKGKMPDEKSVSEADKKKSMEIGTEMMKCQQTAMGAGETPAAPPSEGSAAPAAGGTAPAGGEGGSAAPAAAAPADGSAAAPAGGAAPAAGGEEKKEEKK